jgi:hypothetical protein
VKITLSEADVKTFASFPPGRVEEGMKKWGKVKNKKFRGAAGL